MRRDMSLILAILRWMEKQPAGYREVPGTLPNYDDAERVRYHVELAAEAGYLQWQGKGYPGFYRLTWAGHERLATGDDA